MSSIAQPQDIWTRTEQKPELWAATAGVVDARPVTPAFMARRREDVLSRTIKQQIVPRLILARGAPDNGAPSAPAENNDQNVNDLTEILLNRDFTDAATFVDAVGDRGAGVESIYLDLLAPAARRLGTMWDEDLCDFVRVTIGLGHLQRVLSGLSAPFQDDPQRQARRRRVLIVPAPGDSHSFGMAMVASFFQRAGWTGWAGVPETPADLLRMVRRDSYAVLGFSASCQSRLDALSTAIRAVRRVSINRDIRIMVGGPLFIDHPELVAMVGADATATDGRQAVRQAQNLLALIPSRI